MMFTMPDFPDPVVPPIRTLRRSIQTSTLRPSSNSPSSTGWTMEVLSMPGQGMSPACGSVSITRRITASARESSGEDADAAAPHAQAGFDGRYFRDSILGAGAFLQDHAGGPSPRIRGHRCDTRADEADRFGDIRPRDDGAFHPDPCAASAVDPPRNTQDHCGYRGDLRKRFYLGADGDGCGEPSAGGRDHARGVGAFGWPVDSAGGPHVGQDSGCDAPGWAGPDDLMGHSQQHRDQNGQARDQEPVPGVAGMGEECGGESGAGHEERDKRGTVPE